MRGFFSRLSSGFAISPRVSQQLSRQVSKIAVPKISAPSLDLPDEKALQINIPEAVIDPVFVPSISDYEMMRKFFPSDQCDRQIESCNFYFTGVSDKKGKSIIREGVNFLNKYKVKSLNFDECVIDDSGAEEIAQFIRENKISFEEIRIRKCRISSAGMIKIAEAFEHNYYVSNIFCDNIILSDREVILGSPESADTLASVTDALEKNFSIITGKLAITPNNLCYRETGGFKIRNGKLLEEVVRDYAKMTMGPRFLMQFYGHLESVKSGRNTEFDAQIDKMLLLKSPYHAFKEDLDKAFLQRLFRNVPHQEKLDFIKSGNSNRVISAISKLRKYEGHEWDPLFEGRLPFEGFEFEVRSTNQALIDEGRELRNCIGTYAKFCIENGDQIVSIINPETKESLSTIHFLVNFDEEKIFLKQHEGEERMTPSPLEQKACEKFMAAVNSGEIKINFAALKEARELREEEWSKTQQEIFDINFDPEDKVHYKKVLNGVSNLMKDTPTIRENFLLTAKEEMRVYLRSNDVIVPIDLAPYGKEVNPDNSPSRSIVQMLQGQRKADNVYFVP